MADIETNIRTLHSASTIAPIRPLDEASALDWLRSQPGGRTKLSAAELGRRWGWPRQRTGRRLAAWAKAGLVRRRGDTIAVVNEPSVTLVPAPGTTTAVVPPPVTPAVPLPLHDGAPVTGRGLAAVILLAALALATVSAGFSITGMTAIFVGSFWPVIAMGVALELGKLSAVAWLGRSHGEAWRLRAALIVLIGILMVLNAVGAYGFLSKAHIDHAVAGEVTTLARNADVEARLGVQSGVVADIDRRIAQIDTAIDKATTSGRTTSAMRLADDQRKTRTDLVAQRTNEAKALATLKVEKARADGERAKVEADLGPVRYLATLLGADSEAVLRMFILAIALLLDPAAVLLLLAASARR